jgi:MYXO-CTERM domain-containing protein
MHARRSRLLGLVAAFSLLVPLLTMTPAHAAGGVVTPAKRELEDSGSGWKLLIKIKLPKKPANPHQSFRFIFSPQVIYETFLDDTKPGEQTRLLPQGKDVSPVVESLDVNFGDAKGDIWDTTQFDFTVRRDRGMFAGEYKVEVRDSDDKVVGQSFTLKFNGKNEVIDRRAMVFAGDKKKKKEGPDDKKAVDEKKDDKASTPPADEKPTPSEPDPNAAAAPPPEVPKKPGGCGCQVPSQTPLDGTSAVAIVAVAFGVARRSRRRESR